MQKRIGIIGTQFGDEGKGSIVGKIVDFAVQKLKEDVLLNSYDKNKPILVLRYQGGANAGHTVVLNGKVYKFHQTPSGIIFPHAYSMIGKGVLLNPRAAFEEITSLRQGGVSVSKDNLGIAPNAQVTLDYHIHEDQADFNKPRHTSTGRGIKQTAGDKYRRTGVRFVEFLDEPLFREILRKKQESSTIPPNYNIDDLITSYAEEKEVLKEFLMQEHEALKRHGTHYKIWEGAQGIGLDVDDGFYPGTTSSNPSRVPYRTDMILGVCKLYVSSVGRGERPFVTRIADRNLEKYLIEAWIEKGTTTGKERDLGWFDIPLLKYAIDVGEVDCLVGTCGDRLEVLQQLGIKPKLAIAYEVNGKVYDKWDDSFFNRKTLYNAKPLYTEFEPWSKFVDDNGKISPNAQRYLDAIQELTGKEFIMLNTGPRQEDYILFKDIV